MTDDEKIRMHAAQGLTRAANPDAKAHFRAILDAIDTERPTELVECPVCGKVGTPERIEAEHDCRQPGQ